MTTYALYNYGSALYIHVFLPSVMLSDSAMR